MTLLEYISAERGAGARLAQLIGVPAILISQWAHGYRERRVPLERCVAIERATDGAVTCEELRPDMAEYFAYLRDRADPAQSSATAEPMVAQP